MAPGINSLKLMKLMPASARNYFDSRLSLRRNNIADGSRFGKDGQSYRHHTPSGVNAYLAFRVISWFVSFWLRLWGALFIGVCREEQTGGNTFIDSKRLDFHLGGVKNLVINRRLLS